MVFEGRRSNSRPLSNQGSCTRERNGFSRIHPIRAFEHGFERDGWKIAPRSIFPQQIIPSPRPQNPPGNFLQSSLSLSCFDFWVLFVEMVWLDFQFDKSELFSICFSGFVGAVCNLNSWYLWGTYVKAASMLRLGIHSGDAVFSNSVLPMASRK